MHVALLTNFISPYRAALYEQVAQRVDRLTVLVSQPMGRARPWSRYEGPLDVVAQRTVSVRTRWRHPSGFTEPSDVLVPLDTARQLGRLRPDVVITGEFGIRTLGACAYCRRTTTPLVVWATVSPRSEEGRGVGRRLLRRGLIDRADSIIANGAEGEHYIETLATRRVRVVRVPYTPDPTSVYRGTHSVHRARTLVYVGQLTQRKAVHVILDALAGSPRGLKLVVVGDGAERVRLAEAAERLDLDVDFLGIRQPAEMPAIWRQADALVFPTLADEWGLVTNEALQSGVPVIGSIWAQSVNELVVDGINGWRFNPEDGSSLSASIARLCALSAKGLDDMRVRCRQTDGLLSHIEAAQTIVDECRHLVRSRATQP